MLRISKLTDYATVLLAALAGEPARLQTATALAEHTHIAAPTVSKLLKQLQRAGLVVSTRGTARRLPARPRRRRRSAPRRSWMRWRARWPSPTAPPAQGQCGIEHTCRVGRVWQRLNLAIRRSLHEVTLAQLAGLDAAPARFPALEREMKAATSRHPVRP